MTTTRNGIVIQGDEEFKKLLALLPQRFENNVMRAIARKGGSVIVKNARVNIPGYLGSQIKKDIGVVGDKKNKAGVKVKLRNKYYPDRNGKQRVVSSIALHKTEGSRQRSRKTTKGKYRGYESARVPDFIHEAGKNAGPQAIQVMQKESVKIIEKHVAKWRRRLR